MYIFQGYQELKALNAGHIAAKKGNTRILKMMKELGIRLDIEDNEKHYPIYYAIKYEQRDAFDFLINYGFPSVVSTILWTEVSSTVCVVVYVAAYLFIAYFSVGK